ncbi:MAG: nucleotidyltransferase domain-containing protein [Gammaproteobacteria bacterium]|nr:MAG: nucleotidyltransferase domain-containing protein [Gammaproteobacteria bacterium]RKZ73214.1 MAG: nucleotidyltransferase domain-containing protein [Gammaproteobacteria bacterium]
MKTQALIKLCLNAFPELQAIYLFGSYDTENEWTNSDVDIALLLPYQLTNNLYLTKLHQQLEQLYQKPVDLINLRQVTTVFKKEIIMAERRVYCADQYKTDEFEMLTLSFYQKLNEERQEILQEFFLTKIAYE